MSCIHELAYLWACDACKAHGAGRLVRGYGAGSMAFERAEAQHAAASPTCPAAGCETVRAADRDIVFTFYLRLEGGAGSESREVYFRRAGVVDLGLRCPDCGVTFERADDLRAHACLPIGGDNRLTAEQTQLVRELNGERCRCERRKASGHTFCRGCYFTLPPALRATLYRRMGAGYEQAYTAAAEFLAHAVRGRR